MADSKQSVDERELARLLDDMNVIAQEFPKRKLRAPWADPPTSPAKVSERICLSIIFCSSEADAEKLAERVEARGDTYNGGWLHGCPCGREPKRDYTDESGTRWYAVTRVGHALVRRFRP